MRTPSTNPITLGFGATSYPYDPSSPHRGTDFSYLPDDTIYAPFSGKVTLVPNNGNDGNGVYMASGNLFIGLLHTSKYLVSNGAYVQEGEAIAKMGVTGYAFGKHLHMAARRDGVFIDPLTLFTPGKGSEEPKEMIIPNDDNWYARFRKLMQQVRGRDMSREEFNKNFVGTEAFRMVEAVCDSPEADAATKAQDIGQQAQRENWQGQISSLQSQIQVNNAMINRLTEKANLSDELQKQLEVVKQANQACIDQQQADEEAGRGFFRFLGRLFGK